MSKYLQQKRDRAALVNQLVDTIANTGRNFFLYERDGVKTISTIEVDDRGRIWWNDYFTGKRVYVAYEGRWSGFTAGGTLKTFVKQLAKFLRDGEPLSPHVTGLSNKNVWAYPEEDVKKIQTLGIELGVFRPLAVVS